MMDEALRRHVALREEAFSRVRQMLVEKLKVPLRPEQIDLDAPLFGTGLGLDSIDAVELVVALESELGVILPEGEAGPWTFRTVHALVELVLAPPPGGPS
jgi:acyl carrier protein